jgi:protease I
MANPLHGKKVAILAADSVQRVELEVPREEVQWAGAQTYLLSPRTEEIQARNNDLDAGATVVDHEVVIDGNLISSRSPDDLPAFCRAVVGVRFYS